MDELGNTRTLGPLFSGLVVLFERCTAIPRVLKQMILLGRRIFDSISVVGRLLLQHTHSSSAYTSAYTQWVFGFDDG